MPCLLMKLSRLCDAAEGLNFARAYCSGVYSVFVDW